MHTLIIDLECDGFKPTTIWCLWASFDGTYTGFTDGEAFNEYLQSLPTPCTVYAHNGLAFDYPILERLWGCDFSEFILHDSLVMSRLANPSREGGHSLKSWGARLGYPKGDHSDWSQFSEEMYNYCEQDVAVTSEVLVALQSELSGFSPESINLEHETAAVLAKQVSRGWRLRVRDAYDLMAKLTERKMDLEDTVRSTFVPYPQAIKEVTPKMKADGSFSRVGLNAYAENLDSVGGAFTLLDYPVFNLGSRKQIGEYLIRFGWKPTKLTPKGQPIVDEGTLNGVEIPEAQMIAEYMLLQKRLAMVNSWVEAVDDDDRVHGRVNSCGANTRRMTHNSPNVAQVPASRSPYGSECRKLWTVADGCALVGADADALELRCLAHYMNDPEYIDTVLNGDVHTANQEAAGLPTRDDAKTFIYAFLYGAGDALIGDLVGGGAKAGKEVKRRFLESTPALATLRNNVERASGRGWLKCIDGGRVKVRSQHSALNTLLQSAGAVFMKQALVTADEYAVRNALDFGWVGNIHDELQAEVSEAHSGRFARLVEGSFAAAGDKLGFRIPMTGTAQIGESWYDTH